MKKYCLFAILALLICLYSCSETENQTSAVSTAEVSSASHTERLKTAGNTNGNLTNGGFAVEHKGYIYYANGLDVGLTSDRCLYRVDSDWSEKTLISNDKMHYINIVGEWIYYSNMSDSDNQFWGKLYKMKLDGSERTKISDNESTNVNVYNGWIYYVNCSSNNYNIYKIKTDGTENQKICDDKCDNVIVYNDWIYYLSEILEGSQYKGYLYKIKLDGTEKIKLSDEGMFNFIISNDRIFYANQKDSKLYSMDIDGQDVKVVTEDLVIDFNTDGTWVYYGNLSDDERLYKVKQDGSLKKKMNQNRSWYIHVVGDWIYFANVLAEYTEPYRMKVDGSVEVAIT